MKPGDYAGSDRPAVIMSNTGESVSYAELDERSMRLAQLMYAAGLRPGDHMAVMLPNSPRYYEVYWAAQRSGLYCTPINWHLKPDEAGYIIQDCGAKVLVTSAVLASVATQLDGYMGAVAVRLVIDGNLDDFTPYETAVAAFPAEPLANEVEGTYMFYSSGTTGRPKGIKPPLVEATFGDNPGTLLGLIQHMYGFTNDTTYLCPAPLYHTAPLGWTTAVQRMGGTVVLMEKFEALDALRCIEHFKISHAQFVPTHFVRMLKLTQAERDTYDLSSLRVAVHAAAPCPREVKQQMLAWWGEIVYEYYAGSEGNGFCAVSPSEWLAHPGTVGRPILGTLHILDEDGAELPLGEPGQIWFESAVVFVYHNDDEKTRTAFNDKGWSSLGDVGYLDADGFLYLTDRISHMIISGGVNIYPQEVENELTMHPAVADVAVIGVPNTDLGEEVKAVVIAAPGHTAGPELAAELMTFCRSRLAHFKCPASVDFVDELPRLPTGKLLKRKLRDRYATPT